MAQWELNNTGLGFLLPESFSPGFLACFFFFANLLCDPEWVSWLVWASYFICVNREEIVERWGLGPGCRSKALSPSSSSVTPLSVIPPNCGTPYCAFKANKEILACVEDPGHCWKLASMCGMVKAAVPVLPVFALCFLHALPRLLFICPDWSSLLFVLSCWKGRFCFNYNKILRANNIHTGVKLDHVFRVKRWAVSSWKWVTTGKRQEPQ